ncbi:hypothetical protein MAM1_0001d00086 [Mucor ambiguus]|uniref:Uncharacterized protein n=1 Tax=Mucor ambiguus TaxID=91626 RepID=A0A0C9M3L4_9FUNG|nr:hypothetical protein MAM1_0001d00086 [Mucor ambiguus]
MEKDRLALERRKDIVYNGGGASYDKKIVWEEENRVRRRHQEEERIAKKGRISASSSTLNEDNEADYGEWYDYDDPMSAGDDQQPVPAQRVQTVHNRIFTPKKLRKQFWVEHSEELIAAFLKSFERCGEPNFKLE